VRVASAVLGAGFTGLAAARRLAALAPDAPVALLEAGRAGHGATGRSSGFVVDLAHFIARMPREHGERYHRLARSGIRELEGRMREFGIDAQWDARGWLHAAAGEDAARGLAGLEAWLDGRGEPCERLDGRGIREITGSAFYRAGLRLPGSVLVQPAALARGLAEHLPPGVSLYEESPVESVERRGGLFHLRTAGGEVVADRLLLAANGTTAALGFLKRRVLPLYTFGSFTRPLRDEEARPLGGEEEWGLLAEDPMGTTLRRTRDGRLLVRNLVHFSASLALPPARLAAARALHRQILASRFPGVGEEIELTHTWGGVLGVTPTRDVCFGRLSPGLYAAAGYTGAGIAFGTAAGGCLAELALGQEGEGLLRDALELPRPGWLPPQPWLGLGARLRAWRMNAQARKDL